MPAVTALDHATETRVHARLKSIFMSNIVFIFSGGGYFVRYHGLWALRGLVSSGSSKSEGGCDVGRYSLFTNALDYTEWIDDIVRKKGMSNYLIISYEKHGFWFLLGYFTVSVVLTGREAIHSSDFKGENTEDESAAHSSSARTIEIPDATIRRKPVYLKRNQF